MAEERGELITESSAEVTKMLRERFRAAAAFYATPAVLLVIIGLALWFWQEVQWYVYVVFFVGAAILVVYSASLLAVATGVPSLKVYEGGIMLRPPRQRARFLAWSEFKGYQWKEMDRLKVMELRPRDGPPISIHQYIPEWERIRTVIEENVPPLG